MIGATRSILSTLKAAGLALFLFAAVYAPAFAMVAWLRPSIQIAVPVIIAVSTGLAALIIAILSRGTGGIAEFGVVKSSTSYVLGATAAGVLAGAALAYLAALYP